MRFSVLFLSSALLFGAQPPYSDEATKWRADYEASLKAPDGWLSVAGLFWLHEGSNTIGSDPQAEVVLPASLPKRAGTLTFTAGNVVFEPVSGKPSELKPNSNDIVRLGDVTLAAILRGGKTGVRIRDPHAETQVHFTGTTWFSPSETWRIHAKWIAYPEPRKIRITNILGMVQDEPSPGYAEFTVKGKTVHLEPVIEDDRLFFMFKDETSGRSTYGAGRFLYSAMPKNGTLDLDFNQAHNPPCAFTAFATCPLPPKQNTLSLEITAGEKNYGHH